MLSKIIKSTLRKNIQIYSYRIGVALLIGKLEDENNHEQNGDWQREGIALAKKRGVYKGRKPVLRADQVVLIKERISKGDKKSHIARDLNISRMTLDKYIKQKIL